MNAYIDDVRYSVLSAPLAQIDRRALSQAWISALHLSSASTARSTTPRSLPPRALRSTPASPALQFAAGNARANATAPQSQARNVATVLAGGDRRCAQSTLARRIVELLLAPRNSARRCTLALGGPKGRVHLLLGGSDRRLHLVALCSPRVRDEVTRALREVRYALAARGILATSDLREFA
uniref:Uncharacterized protein n=1 Tax=mine drainage metagenome TaxID=410659 RepID=E6Q5B0_9ZZZZ